MKRILLSLFCLAVVLSCYQLNDNVENVDIEEHLVYNYTMTDGATQRVVMYPGEEETLHIEAQGSYNVGYTTIRVKLEGTGDPINLDSIEMKVFDNEPFIGDSFYEVLYTDESNGEKIFYFQSNGNPKHIFLSNSLEADPNHSGSVIDITMQSTSYVFEELPNTTDSQNRISSNIRPDESWSATSNHWAEEYSFEISLNGLSLDSHYMLIVTRNVDQAIVSDDFNRLRYYLNNNTNKSIWTKWHQGFYEDPDIKAGVFSIWSWDTTTLNYTDGDLSIQIESDYPIGIEYQFSIEEISHSYLSNDIFEPDQGPLSTTLETLSEFHQTSDIHNRVHYMYRDDLNELDWNSSEPDWFKLEPWGTGTYKISFQLENAFNFEGLETNFYSEIWMSIVDSDGATEMESEKIQLTEYPNLPIIATKFMELKLDVDNGQPYFIQIADLYSPYGYVNDYRELLEYRILVEKLD